MLAGDDVGEEAEEGVREAGLEGDLARLKVNVEHALCFDEPRLDILHKCIKFSHPISVKEAPLWRFDQGAQSIDLTWQLLQSRSRLLVTLHQALED